MFIREAAFAERFGWDLNTIDDAPEDWLRKVQSWWEVQEEVAAEQRKAKKRATPAAPRRR